MRKPAPGQHHTPELRALIEDNLRSMAPDETPTHIARRLGIRADSVRNIYRQMQQAKNAEAVIAPAFVTDGDDEEPIEEIIARMSRNYERGRAAKEARDWFPVQMRDDKPVGILFVGDPHIDDNGCNWPALRQHLGICAATDGMYAVNIGDSTNCWGGRLIRKYADQDTSLKTAHRLVEWLMLDSGVHWLLWLLGNHEHMGNGGPLLEQMNQRYGTTTMPLLDWEARFVLRFSNGAEFRINAAHDFPGNSMWNPVHGPVKAAMFGAQVDLLVCGHKHNWAISKWELAEQGTVPLMIRTRGYKHHDDYARRIGKFEQEEGQSILVVFDPKARSKADRMLPFVDIEKGAAYLSTLRAS